MAVFSGWGAEFIGFQEKTGGPNFYPLKILICKCFRSWQEVLIQRSNPFRDLFTNLPNASQWGLF